MQRDHTTSTHKTVTHCVVQPMLASASIYPSSCTSKAVKAYRRALKSALERSECSLPQEEEEEEEEEEESQSDQGQAEMYLQSLQHIHAMQHGRIGLQPSVVRLQRPP